jgi:hypothetical protein
MTNCLTTPELLDFLSRLSTDTTITQAGIIVHAIAGDVIWSWVDAASVWCHG